jgi:hypothetical protein
MSIPNEEPLPWDPLTDLFDESSADWLDWHSLEMDALDEASALRAMSTSQESLNTRSGSPEGLTHELLDNGLMAKAQNGRRGRRPKNGEEPKTQSSADVSLFSLASMQHALDKICLPKLMYLTCSDGGLRSDWHSARTEIARKRW